MNNRVLVTGGAGLIGSHPADAHLAQGCEVAALKLQRSSLDVSRLRALGWAPRTELETGLAETFAWIKEDTAARV